MGVLGLWEVLESVGHPIKIEGLEGKVLGVDANIWLYKFIRGFREKDNATNIDSHKLGLFNRICKLLYYRIKPVFVFDGPAPVLKRRTLERRQNARNKHLMKVQDAAMKILASQLKSQYPDADIDQLKITMPNLISNNLVAAEKLTDEDRDLFYLPDTGKLKNDDSDSDESEVPDVPQDHECVSSEVDINSKDFEHLPPELRYEILHDIKQTRKRIRNPENLPDDANSFSNYQLERLKARRKVQEKIEECEKEICTNYTGELADGSSIQAFRVQSDSRATILYRNNSYSEPKPNISIKTSDTPEVIDTNKTSETNGTNKINEANAMNETNEANETNETNKTNKTNETINLNDTLDDQIELEGIKLLQNLDEPQDITSGTDSEEESSQSVSPTNSATNETVEDTKEILRNLEDLPDDADSSSNHQLEPIKSPRKVEQKIEECEEKICINYAGESADGSPTQAFSVQSDSRATMLLSDKTCSEPKPNISINISDSPEVIDINETNETININDTLDDQIELEEIRLPQNLGGPQDVISRKDFEERPSQSVSSTNRVTNKIVEDAKELLRLFGIPYIDASGEAEAQCAKLEELKLTEGTITDDSDIWLFGSQNVYRYFFNDDKYVMQYKMTDIEFHVRLTRENLVCFAMLVGSDYTDGIMNIGPVTALEVLSEFPGDGLDPLIKFRDWHREACKDLKAAKKDKKRKKLLKYRLPDEFPSRTVYDGYLRPVADTSAEKFTWGTPELDELREYARRNFGWDPKKVDEKLVPVMKRLNEKKVQRTIDTFFFKTQANRNPEMFRSKRVNQALNRIAKRAARDEKAPVPEVLNLSEDED
jgi:5'-3' exonuclease